MAGIADVQPKSIGQVSLPVMAPVVQPGPAGSGVSETLPQAFDAYSNMFNRIKDKPLIDLQRQNNMQQAQITQQNAPAIGAAQAAVANYTAAQAKQQQATLTTADLEKQYIDFMGHAALAKDGSIDHVATAQGGAQINRLKSYASYLQDSLTLGTPIKYWENGVEHTIFKGKNGANLTPNPDGSPSDEETTLRGNLADVLHTLYTDPFNTKNTPGSMAKKPGPNDPAPVVDPAGFPDGTPPTLDRHGNPIDQSGAPVVSPVSQAISPGIPLTPSDVVSSTPLPATPPSTTPVVPQDLVQGVRSNLGLPSATQPAAAGFSPSDALAQYAAWNAQQNANAAQPTEPSAPPPASVVVEPHPSGGSKVTVQPSAVTPVAPPLPVPPASGYRSLVTGYAPNNSPDERVKQMKESPLYVDWTHQTGPIGAYRAAVKSYQSIPQGKPTIGNDVELANSLIRMQNPSGTTRGSEDFHVSKLEDAAPWLERLPEVAGLVLKTHAYPKGTRDRLIAAGGRLAESFEGPARSQVALTAQQILNTNNDPKRYLSDTELGLLGGATGAVGGQQAPVGPVRTLKSGRQVQ